MDKKFYVVILISSIISATLAYGGYHVGYSNGHEAGFNSGYETGYNKGYAEGDLAGYTRGYNNGYSEGNSIGYSRGYNDGYVKAIDDVNMLIDERLDELEDYVKDYFDFLPLSQFYVDTIIEYIFDELRGYLHFEVRS